MKGRTKLEMGAMTAIVGICIGTTAILLNGPAEGQSVRELRAVEATRIVFRDSKGIVRGVVGVAKDGGCGFTFRDASGTERAHLDVTDAGDAFFGIRRRDGSEAVRIAVGADDTAGVVLETPGNVAASGWTMDARGAVSERP